MPASVLMIGCVKGHYLSLYAEQIEARPMASLTMEAWIDDRQAHGRYTFLRAEAVAGSGLSAEAVKKALQRLARRGRVVKAKDYFYVITPLEYRNAGGPPASWFIHDLMAAMDCPTMWASSRLLPSTAFPSTATGVSVVTDRSVRPVKVGRTRIRFFASRYVAMACRQSIKTPTGTMRLATFETTAVDLLRFPGPQVIWTMWLPVLAELSSSLDPKKLRPPCDWSKMCLTRDASATSSTGFARSVLSEPIHAWVERRSPRPVPLRTGVPVTDAAEDRRWPCW